MAVRVQAALGDWVGTGEAVGDPVGDELGGGVGEGDAFGGPSTTLPPGWGEGRFPTGGLGVVAGMSVWPSFLHAAVFRKRRGPIAATMASARRRRIFMESSEFKPWALSDQWMNIASP